MPTESPATTVTETLNYPLEIVLVQYTDSKDWIASVKGMKGVITFADTKEKCLLQIRDAIQTMLTANEIQRQADKAAYQQKQEAKNNPIKIDISEIIDLEKHSKALSLLNEVGPYLQELENLGLKVHFDDRGYDIFKKDVVIDQDRVASSYQKSTNQGS